MSPVRPRKLIIAHFDGPAAVRHAERRICRAPALINTRAGSQFVVRSAASERDHGWFAALMDEHYVGDVSWSGRAEGLVVSHPTGSQRGWKKLAANRTYGPVLVITNGHYPLAALGSGRAT